MGDQAPATMAGMRDLTGLPGADVVTQGIEDLRARRETIPSLLVSIGARRIRDCGVDVPEGLPDPEFRLYDALARRHGDEAHAQYNAWIGRLTSFENALECAT